MSLHRFNVGDKTYVVLVNPETDLPEVAEREVVRVSPKQLEIHGRSSGRVIHRPTHGLHGTEVRWTPIVFATPEAALEEYAAQRYDDIERAKRRKDYATKLRTHALALLHSIQFEKRSI